MIKHDDDPFHQFKKGGPCWDEMPTPKYDINPENAEETFEAKYQEIIETAEKSKGQPVLVIRRWAENMFRGGPGDSTCIPIIDRSVDLGLVRADFSDDLDRWGYVSLATPDQTFKKDHRNISFGSFVDGIKFRKQDAYDYFATIDEKPCFEIAFGDKDITEWLNRPYPGLILDKDLITPQQISDRRFSDHIWYVEAMRHLGREPVLTESIALSIERHKSVLLARLAKPAIERALGKIDKDLELTEPSGLRGSVDVRQKLAVIGIEEKEIKKYFDELLSLDS